jgi:hypothetical protein
MYKHIEIILKLIKNIRELLNAHRDTVALSGAFSTILA